MKDFTRGCSLDPIGDSTAGATAKADQRHCHGCRICRAACPENTITLVRTRPYHPEE